MVAPTPVAATPTPVAATPTPALTPVVAKPKLGGTLRFVPHADLKTLDPMWTTATMTSIHAYFVYDFLFSWDEKNQPQPQMVQDWRVSPDGLEYTFTLRDGLAFHDGTPVTSEETVLSLKRFGQRDSLGKMLFAYLDKIEAVDPKTFTLKFKEPFGLVLDTVGRPAGFLAVTMVKEDAVKSPLEAASGRIGSGPFKLARWDPGHRSIYERNRDYKPRPEPPSGQAGGKVVYLDRVEMIIVPDKATAVAGLRGGEFDYVEWPPGEFYEPLTKDRNVQVFMNLAGAQAWLRFNHLQPPTNDVKFRQALQAAAHQPTYLAGGYGEKEFWRVCYAIFGCGTPYETMTGSEGWLRGDLEKGKRLLRESAYDGRPIVVMAPTDLAYLYNFAVVTKDLLEKLGAKVDFQVMDWATLVARRGEKKPPAEGGWNIFHTDAGIFLHGVFHPLTHLPIDPGWFGWYVSPRMEDAKTQFLWATEPADKKRLVEEMSRIVYEEVPYVNLGEGLGYRAVRIDVKDIVRAHMSIFWNVWLDR
jgi:peptide/nickel transport system substrate-binding protein